MRRLTLALLLLGACSKPVVHKVDARLQADPPSLDFGPVLINTQASKTFELKNLSQVALPFSLTGPQAYQVTPTSGSVDPSGSITVTANFLPVLGEEEDGNVTVTSGDTNLDVPLTGRGVVAAIHASPVDFGPVPLGTPVTLPLVVHNDSELPLSLAFELQTAAPAVFALGNPPATVDAKGTASIDVTYTPQERGRQSGTVLVRPCSICEPVSVDLKGQGAITSVLMPKPQEFGTVTVGRSVSRMVEVSNVGDLPASITAVNVVTGTDFAVQGGATLTLKAGESEMLTLSFSPTREGDASGLLEVLGEAGASLGTVTLHGTGGGPDLVADPSSIDLGLRAVGIPEEFLVQVQNAGTGSVHATSLQVQGAGKSAWSVQATPSVPADVSQSPLSLDVTFLATSEGDFPAEIVVGSDQDDQPELHIPLAAQAIALPPCQAVLSASALRFGIVPSGKEFTRKVHLTNTGTDDCLVMALDLDQATSSFSVDRAPVGTLLHGGQTDDIAVTYSASTVTGLKDLGQLHVKISDPQMPDRTVDLSALATQLDVVALPVDFGSLPVGYTGLRPLTVSNVGKITAQVSNVTLVSGTSDEFKVVTSYPDVKLPPGSIYTAQLSYGPTTPGADEGEAAVNFALYSEPLFVDLTGSGSNEPCGDLCVTPEASCPLEQTVTVDDLVTLAGAASEPGHTLTCAWKVLSAPPESRAVPQQPRACSTTFQPDAPGDFNLQLTVTDDRGETSTCNTLVHAAIGPGLWIELFWSLPGDVDLHLLHPDAGDNHNNDAWNNPPYDCFFGNMSPDWDVFGLPDDDPDLDHDDTHGTGPENIHLSAPVVGDAYSLGLRWFAQEQALTQTLATTRIYCGGQLVDASDTQLDELHELLVFGTVVFDDKGHCKLQKDGTVLHY